MFTLPRIAAALLLALATATAPLEAQSAGEPIKFLRYPSVANDGTIAFTYQDDIWVANPDGTNPRRLTAHEARDYQPRFSPDGRTIAFTSNRNGNNDVFVIPVTGGEPKQLTWMSGNDEAVAWTPDGREVIFSTSRGAMQWGSPLYKVGLDGSIPRSMGMDMARTGMVKQDATLIAFNRMLPSYWRKGYKGNANADIALMDLRSGEIREITDTSMRAHRSNMHDVHPMWGADGKVYFASERDNYFNIWRINTNGSGLEQVTRHRDDGVQFPSISPDGRKIIYENNFVLWTLDVPSGQPRQIPIRLTSDARQNHLSVLTANGRADGFSPSPDGDYVAVHAMGEIFIVPSEQGVGEMKQITNSAWRDQGVEWSPNGRYIAYVSDESREQEVWVYEVATGAKRKVTTLESPKTNLTWAPNGTTLLFTGSNRLYEVDVTRPGNAREIAYNRAGGFSNISYSADGRWLVYTRSNDSQIGEVYLYEMATRRELNISRNPIPFGEPAGGGGGGGGRGGGTGVLTPDGSHVVFTSNRSGTNHLYAVSLTRLTEDQNDPLVRERKAREAAATTGRGGAGGRGGGGGRGGAGAGGGDAAADQAAPPLNIRIDTVGLERRAVQLSTGTNAVGSVFLSTDGRTVYYTVGGGGGGGGGGRGRGAAAAPAAEDGAAGLFAVGIDGQNNRRVASGTFAGITPTPDRRTVFFSRAPQAAAGGGGRGRGNAGGEEIGQSEIAKFTLAQPQRIDRVNFSFPVRVDRRELWQQVLLESWRVMKYQFYDENMHGRDWKAILARYEPLVQYAQTNQDIADIANEMIGELNASHTGVSLPASVSMPSLAQTRYLGFELDEGPGGRYRVSHIYRDGPADREWLDLAVGDYVLAIDGNEIRNGDNYWKLLTNTLNTYIPVRVAKSATGESARTVRIASVTSLNTIKYDEWVLNNRDEVEKATNGEIAYVHIQSMNQPSLEKFRREIDRFWDKKGIIVDIRFNGGGNIDQELIDILERRPYEYWNNRSGSPAWGRRPRQLIAGPKVMMINSRSGSDSEVTPQGFKDLGLGRVVGNPTAAAVIATGSYNLLMPGGTIRTPGSLVVRYDETKPNNWGDNLENFGVEPDVWVRNSPMDNLAKRDMELRAAIAEVQRMRNERPRVTSNNDN